MTAEEHAKMIIGDLTVTIAQLRAERDLMRTILTPKQLALLAEKK